MNKKISITVLLLLASLVSWGQISPLGIPFHRQYTPEEYKGSETNWSVASDDLGLMYFGNEGMILEYDGHEWRDIPVKDDNIQSLCNGSGNIYFGGTRSFGVIKTNALGNHYAFYLSERLGSNVEVNNIWKTYCIDKKIFFCSLKRIFIYDPKEDVIQMVELPKNSFLAFVVNSQLVVGNWEQGLLKLTGNKVELAEGGGYFKKKDIFSVLPYDADRWLIATNLDGLYLYNPNDGKAEVFEPTQEAKQTNKFLKDNNFYTGAIVNDSTYALGTFGGTLLMNKQGRIVTLINKKYGLSSEETTGLMVRPSSPQSMQLWLTLVLGIANVDYPSVTAHFADESGLFGNVQTLKRYNGILYVGTIRGLYTLRFNAFGLPEFVQIKEVEGQVNNLLVVKEKNKDVLLVGSNLYLYKITNGKIDRFNSVDALTYKFVKPKFSNKVVYVVSERSLKRLVLVNGEWHLDNNWHSINEYCEDIQDLPDGKLLCKTKHGLFIVDSSGVYTPIIDREGLKSRIVEVANQVYVISDTSSQIIANDKLLPTRNLDSAFQMPSQKIQEVFQLKKDLLLLVLKEQYDVSYALARKTSTGWNIDTHVAGRVPSMSNPEVILDNDSTTIWIGGSKGLFSLDLRNMGNMPKSKISTLIRSISLKEDSLLYNGSYDPIINTILDINTDGHFLINKSISFKYNYLSFVVALPFYEDEQKTQYSYKLDGFDRGWSRWTNDNKKSYPNLSEGTYKFWVKARNVYGEESIPACVEFEILPPWYRTIIAFILYFIVAILFVYAVVRFYTRKLEEDKKRLEQTVKERTAEVVRQKDEILDKNLEIEKKNKDITDSIRYAKRIQTAVLPNKQSSPNLEYFIYFKPRDIVSGDFYWVYHFDAQNVVIVAAVDCTGHGVPGAFMSMLGVAFLNEIASDPAIKHTDEILNVLRDFVIRSLNQTGKEGESKDGMDIAIARIDLQTSMLEFSGANNPLFLIRDGELQEYLPDKMPIGIHIKAEEPFTRHEIKLQEGDLMYLFSDGFSDQFGGPDIRKYMKRQLKEYLLKICHQPMDQQQRLIEEESIRWMGDLEQIDDQLIIGLRFTSNNKKRQL
ncbi:MAG TPA: SpoIIE family protein phosphatase [Williamwhitmania sp.]|nr:SpoIIE family protein phosphatase [Williamwhitmania sp.]